MKKFLHNAQVMHKCEGVILILVMGKYSAQSVIACYTFEGKLVKIYKTAKEASDKLKLFSRSVDKAIRLKTTVGGYQWRRYISSDDVLTSIEPYETPLISKENIKVAKCNEDGKVLEIYPSIKKAAKENNVSPKQIRECLLGHQKRAGSHYWKKVD